ncbi:siphovirus Gp157 family protein [Chroococcus sp. FPU101]|uniref:siphovirus Gp157 family protein n=1 Tax=Chroococcus sp. FPU101 TaxID=1974212 RepID=UPI001A8CD501|nr:siphovirus Gp157 family protein [Chroococcus sp. FPU101]GFE69105.1 hypothetical protein CFPU101_17150 [Chroococcus sp. FPU101]
MSNLIYKLLSNSHYGSYLWENLERLEDEEFIKLIQSQISQEELIDQLVEIKTQLEADIIAIKARISYLNQIHQTELERLERWNKSLDQSLIKGYQAGMISEKAIGQKYAISFRLNPPSCTIIDEATIAPEYITQKTTITQKIDKKAIIEDWKQGIDLPGVSIEQKIKVIYQILKNTNFNDYQSH